MYETRNETNPLVRHLRRGAARTGLTFRSRGGGVTSVASTPYKSVRHRPGQSTGSVPWSPAAHCVRSDSSPVA